jgi:hypothetical protein
MKGMGAEFADLGRRDVGINPATGELQGRAIGPLPIRHHEISTRLGDNDLFTVELDLDVHDEAVSHKEAPAGCVTRRSFQLEMLAASQRRKILLGIVT